jgi:hypothetical protein
MLEALLFTPGPDHVNEYPESAARVADPPGHMLPFEELLMLMPAT